MSVAACSNDLTVGSSTGALKVINLAENAFENVNSVSGLNVRTDEITRLSWAASGDETEILCAQVDRQLKLFDSVSNSVTPLFMCEGGEGRIRGLEALEGNKIVTAVESGLVKGWDLRNGKETFELSSGADLCCMRCGTANRNQLATGGKEHCLKVWDMGSPEKKQVFTAKNVKPNWLNLRAPVWVTDVRFLPDSEQLVACTGYHQIRFYDPKAQRRPVAQVEWQDEPFMSMGVCRNPMQVVAGNTKGEMALFDLRGKAKMAHRFKGFAGSIRGIECHPTAPYVASCSADRFVRVHQLDTKELMHKIYCKSSLNCLLMKKNLSILERDYKNTKFNRKEVTDSANSSDSERSDSDDDVWEGMGKVSERKQKRKSEQPVNSDRLAKVRKLKFSAKKLKRRVKEEPESDQNETVRDEQQNGCLSGLRKRKRKTLNDELKKIGPEETVTLINFKDGSPKKRKTDTAAVADAESIAHRKRRKRVVS